MATYALGCGSTQTIHGTWVGRIHHTVVHDPQGKKYPAMELLIIDGPPMVFKFEPPPKVVAPQNPAAPPPLLIRYAPENYPGGDYPILNPGEFNEGTLVKVRGGLDAWPVDGPDGHAVSRRIWHNRQGQPYAADDLAIKVEQIYRTEEHKSPGR